MLAFASSFHAWKSIESQEGSKGTHAITFGLAIVEAIGEPHGLKLVPEETVKHGPIGRYDAVFISVLDTRNAIDAASHFRRWRLPLRRVNRTPEMPLVWMGGQGLRNPVPFAPIADLIVLGDAEEPLPLLLEAWNRHGNSDRFLRESAAIRGVYVPSIHDRRTDRLEWLSSPSLDASLQRQIKVCLTDNRRIEISRGCRHKCPFCGLGWRTSYRENDTGRIVEAIRESPTNLHLQAGDAEGHSGIEQIRTELAGKHIDGGWTGRLDSVMRRLRVGGTVPANKRYAFGIEGTSERLRLAIGKRYLTDRVLIDEMCSFLDRIDGASVGRTTWHMMGGLPTEQPAEALCLLRVLRAIDKRRVRERMRNLEIHWQPFQPIPGTPMAWCECGSVDRMALALLESAEHLNSIRIRHIVGRSNEMTRMCTVLARADERGADLIERVGERPIRPKEAASVCGVSWDTLDTSNALPWEFIRCQFTGEQLRRAHDVVVRRLRDSAPAEMSIHDAISEAREQ